jgi:hypothetical protein
MPLHSKTKQKRQREETFVLPRRELTGNENYCIRQQLRHCLDNLLDLDQYDQKFLLAVYLLPHLSPNQLRQLDGISEQLHMLKRKHTPTPEKQNSCMQANTEKVRAVETEGVRWGATSREVDLGL